MARLHWFWRAAIAVVAGGGFLFALTLWLVTYRGPSQLEPYFFWILAFSGWVVTPTITVVVYRRLSGTAADLIEVHETRCRKCGYILRGLTEPRCSECGEKI